MRAFLGEHWFLLALAGLLGFALAWPELARDMTGALGERVVIASALFLMAWTLPSRNLAGEMRQPGASLWALVLSYGLVPAGAWLAAPLLPAKAYHVGLLISASVPCTLASAVLWTRLAGGNEATALLVTTLSTASSWLITTGWLTLTTGTSVEVRPLVMMWNLLVTLLLPVAIGQGLRAVPFFALLANRRKTLLGVGAQFLILSILFKAAAQVGSEMARDGSALEPAALLLVAAVCGGLHLTVLAVGLFSSGWLGFDRPRSIAVAFACSQKTLPVALFLFVRHYQEVYPLGVASLLCYHVGQLLLDTVVAKRLACQKRLD